MTCTFIVLTRHNLLLIYSTWANLVPGSLVSSQCMYAQHARLKSWEGPGDDAIVGCTLIASHQNVKG